MEKWRKYSLGKIIELIDQFEGGNQELNICFTDDKKKKWVLHFDSVWDFRYAVENAFIDRSYQLEKNEACEGHSCMYIVQDSEYIEYFHNQVSGSIPTDELKHFVLFDRIDTGIDILTLKEPVLFSRKPVQIRKKWSVAWRRFIHKLG